MTRMEFSTPPAHRRALKLAGALMLTTLLALTGCATTSEAGAPASEESGSMSTEGSREAPSTPDDADGVHQIKDMSPGELAHYAQAGYMSYDFNPVTARLLFHGLLEHPNNLELLQTMANSLVEEAPALSAVTFEFLRQADLGMTNAERREVESMYASAMWLWGLSSKTDGTGEVTSEDFNSPSRFTYDRDGYRRLFQDVLAEAGGVERAVRGATALMGLYGGFLEHRNGPDYQFDRAELFGHQRFAIQPVYGQWLQLPVREEFGMFDPYVPES